MDIFQLFISAIFVNNIVLAQYLGNCPYLGCSKEKGVALGMGGAVIFVIIVATACTWLMQRYVLEPFGLGSCRPSSSSWSSPRWCSSWRCSSRRWCRPCMRPWASSCR